MDDFASRLQSEWRLRIKPSSRMCMVPNGSTEMPADLQRWKLSSEFPVLGHTLESNGHTNACWRKTRQSMWKAFFANCKASGSNRLDVKSKTALVGRSVLPVMQHRNTRWPPSRQRCTEIAQVQRKMVSSILRVPVLRGELPADYARRRNRAATTHINATGDWRRGYCQRVADWDDHCHRPRNGQSWAAKLIDFRAEAWLAQRRREHTRRGDTSRLDCRSCQGAPAPRWHKGMKHARLFLAGAA